MPSTLIDTNVLIDLLEARTPWVDWASKQLELLAEDGGFLINQIVFGEVSVPYDQIEVVNSRLTEDWIKHENLPWEAAFRAGKAHADYRKRGGQKGAIMPDFLVAAHAAVMNYRFLTRDAARFRVYFPDLKIIAPDTHP